MNTTTMRVVSEGFDDEELQVEYDIIPIETNEKVRELDRQIELIQREIDKCDSEIDRLTNHADGIDYAIAVASGIISGLIDSFFVGELSLDSANEWGNQKVDNFVVKIAQSQGYDGNDLGGAVRHLEGKFPIAADKVTNDFGGGVQHHLRDFSHHPTPIGLFFSLLTQFTGSVFGTDVAGVFKAVPVDATELIGKNLPEKITFGVVKWFFHMVSDMAGSSTFVVKGALGTGLPGPLVSFLKEISALPIFRNMNEKGYKEFSVWISKLFNGSLFGKRDGNGKLIEAVKFDLRTEIGIVHELGKQTIPVIINECIVRGFYFARRLFTEIKENKCKHISDLRDINWKNTLPFKNRTVARMLTISSATFTALDIGDAAVRAVVNSGGVNPATASQFILRVNFVGVGRLVVAVGTDVTMGVKRNRARRERMRLNSQMLHLLNAKVAYKQADMWVTAEDTEKAIKELYKTAEASFKYAAESMKEIGEDMEKIGEYIESAEEKNPGLTKDLLEELKWG